MRFRQRFSNIRMSMSGALGMIFLPLALALIGTLAGMLWSVIQSEQNAERIAALSAVDRVAFETAAALRVVRAKVLAASAAGVTSHFEYEAIRREAEGFVARAFPRLDPTVVPAGSQRVEGLRQAWAEINWAGLEKLETKSPTERRQAIDHWFSGATKMVNRLNDLSKAVVNRIRTADLEVATLMPVRQLAWALRETSGNECLLMRPVVVGGGKPPHDIQVKDLADSSEQILEASAHLTEVADGASSRTAGATIASNEATRNVHAIASAAEELSASVTEINRQVSQSNVAAEQAVREAERTNDEMKALDGAAKRIGDVIRLVTAIAKQTNLLARNATIEAARAGEAGRGFAIVATEVKALASQTATATEETSRQIIGVQQATVRSVAAIATIQQTIHEFGEITASVANAVVRQDAATDEIARSTEIASKHTAETTGEVGRVSDATEDTRKEAAAVRAVADKLDTVAQRVRNQVDDFFRRLNAA